MSTKKDENPINILWNLFFIHTYIMQPFYKFKLFDDDLKIYYAISCLNGCTILQDKFNRLLD